MVVKPSAKAGDFWWGSRHQNCLSHDIASRDRDNAVNMEEIQTDPPPRKRLKLQHNLDGAMDQIVAPDQDNPMADVPSVDEAALQLDKEVQCGITEFIHSDAQAFTGVLKKR